MTLDDTGFLAEASYMCAEGHVLVGDRVRICTASAMWSGPVPTCEGKQYKAALSCSLCVNNTKCYVFQLAKV